MKTCACRHEWVCDISESTHSTQNMQSFLFSTKEKVMIWFLFHTRACIHVFSVCTYTHMYRTYTGIYHMRCYFLFFCIFFEPHPLQTVSREMQHAWLLRGSSHGQSRAEVSPEREPRFLIIGTPKGQAEGPEKPAAWDYYVQRGATSKPQRGASSCSLSSSSPT